MIVKSSWLFAEVYIKSSNVFRSFKSKTSIKAVRMFNIYNEIIMIGFLLFSMFKEIKTHVFL